MGLGEIGGPVRSTVPVARERRVLCVFPHYTPAFGTFNHAYRLMKGVRAFMPPQGLLLIAAYLPPAWPVRFVDENIARATPADFEWAEIVAVSGMHVQAPQVHDIAARAHAAGKVVMLGGPSASASPEMYPDVDYLHVGEIGDATDALIARLDASVERPSSPMRFETEGATSAAGVSNPGLRPHPAQELSDAHPAVLQRLSLSLRILRYPESLRPPAAAQDLRADHRRARRHVPAEGTSRRWSISSTTISSATARPRKTCCRISSPGRRARRYPLQFACEATLNIAKQTGDARAHARGVLPRPVRRHRDAGGGCAQGHAQGAERLGADARIDQDAQ